MHAYVHLKQRYTRVGKHTALAVEDGGIVYYPNVQGVNNRHAWLKYIAKEDQDPEEYNISVKQAIDAREHHKRVLGKRLLKGENLAELVQEEGNEHLLFDYKKIKQSIDAYTLDSMKP